MPLDEANEFVITLDSTRSVSGVPTTTGVSIVLTVEDPHSIAVVEISKTELDDLIAGLTKLRGLI